LELFINRGMSGDYMRNYVVRDLSIGVSN